MSIEQRFYSTPMNQRTMKMGAETITVESPALLDENREDGSPFVERAFTSRTQNGETVYLFGASPEAWAEFDAKYPNQDADEGEPYRRRYPRTNLPDVDFGG